MTCSVRATLLAPCLLASAAAAQFVGPGLSWTGTSGNAVRDFVPSCTNHRVAAVRGETITVRVWGDLRAPYALFAAGSGSQCLPIPGFGNALVLDLPLFTVTAGFLVRMSPCLACPPGHDEVRFDVPAALPPGASLSLQAISLGAGRPAFTAAITGTAP
jgi:hypothetical protein